jgi:hypothetical protein
VDQQGDALTVNWMADDGYVFDAMLHPPQHISSFLRSQDELKN